MITVWKPIKDFNKYLISEKGEVFRNGLVKPSQNGTSGYNTVSLSQNGQKKTYAIHRLVLETFIGEAPLKCVAHHKDGNPQNNIITNLKWVSRSFHSKYHKSSRRKKNIINLRKSEPWCGERVPSSKLTKQDVVVIRNLRKNYKYTIDTLAMKFQVYPGTISKIINRKTWKHIK